LHALQKQLNYGMLITGIDIGGSHLTAGLVDNDRYVLKDSTVIRDRVNSHAPAAIILADWCASIQRLWKLQGIAKSPLAFAMPGPFDYKKGICLIKGFGKYEALYQVDVRAELSRRLSIDPADIRFRNDAEAFLAGEVRSGAAKGYQHAIGITLGTGMGTAKSHNGIAEDAEMSFKVFVDGATIEEYISTRGLLRAYSQWSGKEMNDVKAMAAQYDNNIDVRKAFLLFAEKLAYLLAIFIKEEQPEVLVVGGNIASAWDLFMPDVITILLAKSVKMPIVVKAEIGEHAAIIGAATLFSPL
jgi:glucokinase